MILKPQKRPYGGLGIAVGPLFLVYAISYRIRDVGCSELLKRVTTQMRTSKPT